LDSNMVGISTLMEYGVFGRQSSLHESLLSLLYFCEGVIYCVNKQNVAGNSLDILSIFP
jgi:hypothetical protein